MTTVPPLGSSPVAVAPPPAPVAARQLIPGVADLGTASSTEELARRFLETVTTLATGTTDSAAPTTSCAEAFATALGSRAFTIATGTIEGRAALIGATSVPSPGLVVVLDATSCSVLLQRSR